MKFHGECAGQEGLMFVIWFVSVSECFCHSIVTGKFHFNYSLKFAKLTDYPLMRSKEIIALRLERKPHFHYINSSRFDEKIVVHRGSSADSKMKSCR